MKHDDDHKEKDEEAGVELSDDAVPEVIDDEDDLDDEPITPESDFEDRDF